jgi:uncharacterized protein
MKIKALLIIFSLLFLKTYSQSIETASKFICDSISKLEIENIDSLFRTQVDIFGSEELKYFPVLIDTTRKHIKNQINELNYKLIRELNKNCPNFKIKTSAILFNTSVVDIECIFNPTQLDSIDDAVKKLRKNKDLVLLVVTIDDLFPYMNFEEYAKNQLKNWEIGALNSKGGVIVVFSKSMREIRIATNSIARKYLSDDECADIIQNVMLPKFKQQNYSKAILNSIDEIYNKI